MSAAPASFRDYCRGLRPWLQRACRQSLEALLAGGGPPGGLAELVDGGKRLRGCLVCLAAESLGAGPRQALPRAVAVELIHCASLVHDDLVDGDRLRRGRPAAWTVEGARRAVLLGDVIFASAIEMAARLGAAEAAVVAGAIARLAKGAYLETSTPQAAARALESGRLGAGAYAKIADLKTGVLFGAACRLGAAAAGAGDGPAGDLEQWGRLVGQAYQMEDDLQELRLLEAARRPGLRRLAELSPALAAWAPELPPGVLAGWLRGGAEPGPELAPALAAARQALARELEARLAAAEKRLAGLPAGPHAELLRGAGREIIGLFREQAEPGPSPGPRSRRSDASP